MTAFDPTIQNWIAGGATFPMSEDALMYDRMPQEDLDSTEEDDSDARLCEEDLLNDDDDETSLRSRRNKPPAPLREVPSWFGEAVFQYNGRLLLAALPGLLLVLSLSGDLLIGLITVGGLIIYLLHTTGATNKAFVAYIITFLTAHSSVIYSTLPLLWASMLNIFLLAIVNMFTTLTGCWLALQFEYFILSEPELAKTFETMLFTFYPALSVVLLSWVVALLQSAALVPYCLIIFGFILFQMFTVPSPSSFYNLKTSNAAAAAQQQYTDEAAYPYVLHPAMVGTLATIYSMTPIIFFTLISISFGKFGILETWIEFVFIGCLSFSLATFMNLREFLDLSGFSPTHLHNLRYATGLTAIMLLSSILGKYGFSIYLLPWLSVGIVIHTMFGVFVGQKHKKMQVLASGLALILLYSFVFYKLPWKLNYHIVGDHFHISSINVALLANSLLCIGAIYASVFWPKEISGLLFTLQSLSMVVSEKLLLFGNLYHCSLMALSAASTIYAASRLQSSGKLGWQHAWLSSSLHLSKYADCCLSLLPSKLRPEFTLSYMLYVQSAALALTLLTMAALAYEDRQLSINKWCGYVVGFVMLICANTPTVLLHTFWLALGIDPTFADLTGLGVILVGFFCVNLGLRSPESWFGAKYSGSTLLGMGMLMMQLQPDGSLTWMDMSKWVLMLDLVGCVMVAPLLTLLKDALLLCILTTLMVFPVGFTLSLWILPESTSLEFIMLLGLILGLCVDMMVLSWRRVARLEKKLTLLFLLVIVCMLALLVTEWMYPIDTEVPVTAISLAIALMLLSIAFKIYSPKEKHTDLAVSGVERHSHLTLAGNICCLLTFIAMCSLCPTQHWQIWYIGCSGILILLQQDTFLLSNLTQQNQSAPIFYVVSLVLWAATLSASSFWTNRNSIAVLTGFIELLLLLLVLPVFYVFFTLLWNNQFYISDKTVVFLAPSTVFLFIFGTTYSAWILALYTLAVASWMMKAKLPLNTER